MWPNILDLTPDECRGVLRRLELETYSNVVGAFRAQGVLNADKLRILKDLREAFHISDARHKAEVRRVVNDESLSTIAKMTYGPNSEIEWNKEGSRGFLIINRKPSQTALSSVADNANELGKNLNKHLQLPSKTSRTGVLSVHNETSNESMSNVEIKKRDTNKLGIVTEQAAVKTITLNAEPQQMPCPITANSRRRKSTTGFSICSTPPKTILISNRRDTMVETSPNQTNELIEQPQPQPLKMIAKEAHAVSKNINESRDELSKNNIMCRPDSFSHTISNNSDLQIIEAVVPHKVSTIKGTRNVMNAISQGAQLVKVIDSKIIKNSATLSNMHVTKTFQTQSLKAPTMKQTFLPIKVPNIEFLPTNDCARLSKSFKGHKIQVIASNASSMMNNIIQKVPNLENDIISIPTARNPNIVKTSDKTIMHVSPHLPQKSQVRAPVLSTAQNQMKYQQKHVIQVMQPQPQTRMVTIHPNSPVLKAPTPVLSLSETPQEYLCEEQINDWQQHNSRHIDNQNGYIKIINRTKKSSNNEHNYQNHEDNIISESVIYDDDIITEEYITSEDFNSDHIIEM